MDTGQWGVDSTACVCRTRLVFIGLLETELQVLLSGGLGRGRKRDTQTGSGPRREAAAPGSLHLPPVPFLRRSRSVGASRQKRSALWQTPSACDIRTTVHGSRGPLLIPGHLGPGLLQRGTKSLHLCAERSQFPSRNTVC